MPYIGKNLVGILKDARASDTMTGDGSDTTLTLTDTPGSTNNVLVFIDGIRQTPVTDYTVMGNALTFTTAPEAGVLVVALTGSASSIDPKMGSVTSMKIVDGMVGNAKIAALSSSKLTGALPAISGANLTNISGTGIDNVTSDPTISENPSGGVGTIQLNQNSGEMFVCTDATAGENVWINVGGGSGDIEPYSFQGTIAGFTTGGHTGANSNIIDKFNFGSANNATDHGDLTFTTAFLAGASSATDGFAMGGALASNSNIINKFPFASQTNATDHGDLSTGLAAQVGASSGTHGFSMGGTITGGAVTNIINKFSVTSNTTAADHGDISVARKNKSGHSASAHGYTAGGNPLTNVIDKFAFVSNTTATDHGDLTTNTEYPVGGQSSTTHGYHAGGGSPDKANINKFAFASNTTAAAHGNLSAVRRAGTGQSSTTDGYATGGQPSNTNVIEKFAFSTNSTAADHGDLSVGRGYEAGQQY